MKKLKISKLNFQKTIFPNNYFEKNCHLLPKINKKLWNIRFICQSKFKREIFKTKTNIHYIFTADRFANEYSR